MNDRVKLLQVLLIGLFIPILISLWYLQVYKGNYYHKKSLDNILRVMPHLAPRGEILDSNNNKLVDSFANFQIALIPQEVEDLKYTLAELSKQFNISASVLNKRFNKGYLYPFAPITLVKSITKQEAIAFESRNHLKGVIVNVLPKRRYFYEQVASHVLGYLGEIDGSQLKRLKRYGYSISDYVGKSGIEEYYDSYLRGEAGGSLIEVDSKGARVKILGFKKPIQGKNIKLTLDIRLQELVDELLSGKRGTVIVMEPRTGFIRALTSKPNFDPNLFLDYSDNQKIINYWLRSEGSPLFNRAISGTYPPGSTFKIIVAAAALEDDTAALFNRYTCNGSISLGPVKFRCWKEEGHGSINLLQALKYSCNVYFYRLGLKLGVDKITNAARKFGFGKKTGIKLTGEVKGVVPSKDYKQRYFNSKWYKGDTVNFSIGQGYIQMTPVQALAMLSVVANKGFMPKPKLVEGIGGIDTSSPELTHIDISRDILKKIEKGLIKVVEDPDGTGRLANIYGITVAGKTGTAQLKDKESHAWFLGYAPAENPAICLVVLVEHGGKGGIQSAKIAKEIFKYYLLDNE